MPFLHYTWSHYWGYNKARIKKIHKATYISCMSKNLIFMLLGLSYIQAMNTLQALISNGLNTCKVSSDNRYTIKSCFPNIMLPCRGQFSSIKEVGKERKVETGKETGKKKKKNKMVISCEFSLWIHPGTTRRHRPLDPLLTMIFVIVG